MQPVWGGAAGQMNNCFKLTHRHTCMQRHHMSEAYGCALSAVCPPIVSPFSHLLRLIHAWRMCRYLSDHHMGCLNLKSWSILVFMRPTLFICVAAFFHTPSPHTYVWCSLCLIACCWLYSLCCDRKGSCVSLGGMFSWFVICDPRLFCCSFVHTFSHVSGIRCVPLKACFTGFFKASGLLMHCIKGTSAVHL